MAVSEASYAVGNRVYRGGSSAPTLGTVDPSGYVERSLNQPSDSRSGLAAAALRRLGGQDGAQSGPSISGPMGPVADVNSVLGGLGAPVVPTIPTVRDAVKARMGPDGSYRLNVREIQQQVSQVHDYAEAAQRALEQMVPTMMPAVEPQGKAKSNASS